MPEPRQNPALGDLDGHFDFGPMSDHDAVEQVITMPWRAQPNKHCGGGFSSILD
jgi:hypothetical protein